MLPARRFTLLCASALAAVLAACAASAEDAEGEGKSAAPAADAKAEADPLPAHEILDPDEELKHRRPLTPEQREQFLSERTAFRFDGTFAKVANEIQRQRHVLLYAKHEGLQDSPVEEVVPEDYKPTWRERLDVLARQTQSTWRYNEKWDVWAFTPGPAPLPYRLALPEKWTENVSGRLVFYRPQSEKPDQEPIYLEIYMMGAYSFEKDAATNCEKVRDELALTVAKNFDRRAELRDMKKVKLGHLDTRFYQVKTAQADHTWRQWVFVSDGQAFVATSMLHDLLVKDHLPEIEKALESFELVRTDKKE